MLGAKLISFARLIMHLAWTEIEIIFPNKATLYFIRIVINYRK